MSSKASQLTLKSEIGGKTIEEVVNIEAQEFPKIVEFLESSDGDLCKEELTRLIRQFWRARASRKTIRIFAKIVFFGAEQGSEEESVLVEDISASGIRVSISRDAELDLRLLSKVHFLFAVKQGEERKRLNLAAEFIRVAHAGDEHLSLAFRFTSITAEESALLDQGTNLFFT